MADRAIDLLAVPGLGWQESSGQATLSGPLLELSRQLDGVFQGWAAAWPAEEYRFPAFLPVAELEKVDYFRSFPHLATFPVSLDAGAANLEKFTAGGPVAPDGEVLLTDTAPVQHVLTPAACYHFYVMLQGKELAVPRYLTTCGACFRREAYYAPLQRQWGFTMREIVCLGTLAEVEEFLDRSRAQVDQFCEALQLPVSWKPATDPFFRPRENPRYLWQRVAPVKTELIFPGPLALASINCHHDFFGRAFGIQREGRTAYSGCVAFGLERWLYAWLSCFGAAPTSWPGLEPWLGRTVEVA